MMLLNGTKSRLPRTMPLMVSDLKRRGTCSKTVLPSIGSMSACHMGKTGIAILGMVERRLLFVAYTMRGDTIRIISAGDNPMKNADIVFHEENAY